MAVFVTLTLWFFIGRIEGISQAAAMEFFERAQGQDVYVRITDTTATARIFTR